MHAHLMGNPFSRIFGPTLELFFVTNNYPIIGHPQNYARVYNLVVHILSICITQASDWSTEIVKCEVSMDSESCGKKQNYLVDVHNKIMITRRKYASAHRTAVRVDIIMQPAL